MLSKLKKFVKLITKKFTAIATVCILFANSMLSGVVFADVEPVIRPNSRGHFIEIQMAYDANNEEDLENWEDYRVIPITLNLTGDIPVSGFDISLNYDKNKLTPMYEKRRAGMVEATTITQWDPLDNDYNFEKDYSSTVSVFDPENGHIKLVATRATSINPDEIDESIVVGTMFFKLNDGYELSDLDGDTFTLQPDNTVPESGYEIAYGTLPWGVTDGRYFGLTNFATESKSITNITIKKNPTKTTYTQDEVITQAKLAGGIITINYSDGSSTDVKMTNLDVEIITQKADIVNPIIRIKYKGHFTETDIPITVQNPVTDVEMITPPTKLEYTQDEAINFAGGQIKITFQNGDTTTLSTTNTKVVKNETVADLNQGDVVITGTTVGGLQCGKKTITLTYEGKSVTYDIIINDAIKEIRAEDYKVNYKIGDLSIDRSQGNVVVETNAGAIFNVPFTNGSVDISGFKSYDVMVNRPITVKYLGKQTTYNVNINDYLKSISIDTLPTKTNYRCGEALDLTGGKIHAVYASTADDTVDMTDPGVQVTGFETLVPGDQTLTITYDGLTSTFGINVIDELTGIEIENPPKKEYIYNDEFDYTTGTLLATHASGNRTSGIRLNDTGVTVAGYDKTTLGDQTITVSYVEEGITKTLTYDIEVQDKATSLVISKEPAKKTYKYGEKMEVEDGTIDVEYMNSPSDTVGMQTKMLSETDGSIFSTRPRLAAGTTTMAKTVQVNYRGMSTTYPITVINNVTKIEVTTLPTKTKYKYGEEQDLTGGIVIITRANGETLQLDLTDPLITVTGFDSSKENLKLPLTVSYTENGETVSTKLNIVIEDDVTAIRLNKAPKGIYKYGEEIEDLTMTVTRLSGNYQVKVTKDMMNYDPRKLGIQTVTLNYGGQKLTFDAKVEDYVEKIRMRTKPTKIKYELGEKIDIAGATIQEIMASGVYGETINVTEKMISGFDSKTEGTKTITVTYKDMKTTFTVVVGNAKPGDEVEKIVLKSKPTKTVYKIGEKLNIAGAEIQEVMKSGQKGNTIIVTEDMISGFDTQTEGTKTITITYKNMKTTFTIVVEKTTPEDEVEEIVLKTKPTKTKYKIGEKLDITGVVIQEVMRSGRKGNTIVVTEDMISGFDTQTEGTKTITITYKNMKVTFQIIVEKEVKPGPEPDEIDIVKPEPKSSTTYNTSIANYIIKKEEISDEINEESQPEVEKKEKKKDKDIPGITTDKDDSNGISAGEILRAIIGILVAGSFTMMMVAAITKRRNVKIYLEAGNRKILIGKEKLTKDNRKLDLSKYYDVYREEEFNLVLSKSISEKLNNKTVNVIIHDEKQENFKVEYENKEYIYRT